MPTTNKTLETNIAKIIEKAGAKKAAEFLATQIASITNESGLAQAVSASHYFIDILDE